MFVNKTHLQCDFDNKGVVILISGIIYVYVCNVVAGQLNVCNVLLYTGQPLS